METATFENGVYVTLGLTLVSFVLTFGLAPKFKALFKEDDSWRDMYAELVETGGVASVSPQDAAREAAAGAVLMDIRLARKFDQGAMKYSLNCPLYQPISGWSLAANIRRAGFAFFGIFGTERNTRWLTDVQNAVPAGSSVIVACDMGGSLDKKPGADTGFQSQSLKAAFYLKRAGYRVQHLQGGVDAYRREVGPLVPGADVSPAPARALTESVRT